MIGHRRRVRVGPPGRKVTTMDLFTFLEDTNTLKVDPKPWMTGGDYILARATNDTLTGIIDDCIAGGLYALDLETTGLNSCVYDGETTSKIVGCCLSPDGKRGYYIPLRHKTGQEHNVSWSQWKREMQRLIDSPARAIFHNGKFDQEFLQNCGGEPLGEWDEPKKWEDTLILAYLRDTRSKSKGLKHLSKTELGMEMIELEELFPEDRRKGDLDFSDLDPSWEPVTWYGASDAICTWNLYQKLHPQVIPPSMGQRGQGIIYAIEKLCVASTRWMERARIMTDQVKARELIRIGQREWLASLEEVYESSSAIVGRDVRPGYYRIMQGAVQGLEGFRFDTEEVSPSYMDRVETARAVATKGKLDPLNEKKKVKTVTKRVASLNKEAKGVTEDVEFPVVYDVLSAQQLGSLLRECKVPGLTATEKSGQVATSADELEKVLESVGDKFPFAGKIKRFREVSKALSTYLLPLIEDSHPDGSLRAYFNAFSIDTGRFNAPSSKNPKMDGGTRFPFHGTPATYDPNRPECMGRIRECIIARPGKVIAGIDFSSVELRIVTNISSEPKWLREFFHCSGCDKMFPMGTAEDPVPVAPPPYCPDCGSDKIGDLHTLTALSLYGEDAPKRENWKQLRSFGKSCNFALCYGGSGNAVVTATGCDKNEGYRIKDQFDKTYKVLSGWWKTQAIAAKNYKFVTTAFGRRYPLPDIDHEMGGFRAKAERNAVNGPIQGCLHFDSKIPTSLGLLTVKELWDRQAGGEYDRFKVWTGKAWVDGRALFSGVKELRVTTFSNGITIRTSPEHLFRVLGKEGDLRWVRQDDLKVGFYAATDSGNRDNQDYQYTQVTDKVVTNQFVTMYDIEVFDDDHAFVCDGMVVHNTSADITKIAMGLVYRECKQRGWLDKVHMLITMHDELVFEIDKDILEEAVDIFVRLMCRNELVQKLNWPVPLTSDVEMGPNWMVEWDLKKIRKKGECPPELEGCFKGIGPKAKAEALKGNAQPVEKKPELTIFTYKLKGFTLGEIEPLARILAAGASNPVAKLVVVGPNGEDLTGSLSVVWSGKIPMVGEA